ncbi:hypothetical protein M0R19_05450 [Candidatus Pacearchaeota archaeon]|jgi:hypothetical protein|nr:hypothetical protein [Candidatus Pacearchaeota archaeon]
MKHEINKQNMKTKVIIFLIKILNKLIRSQNNPSLIMYMFNDEGKFYYTMSGGRSEPIADMICFILKQEPMIIEDIIKYDQRALSNMDVQFFQKYIM